jgi:hypothetical protein
MTAGAQYELEQRFLGPHSQFRDECFVAFAIAAEQSAFGRAPSTLAAVSQSVSLNQGATGAWFYTDNGVRIDFISGLDRYGQFWQLAGFAGGPFAEH